MDGARLPEVGASVRDYWSRHLEGFVAPASVAGVRAPGASPPDWSPPESVRVDSASLAVAAWVLLLARAGGHADVILGVDPGNGAAPDGEARPFRFRMVPGERAGDFVARVAGSLGELRRFAGLPVAEIRRLAGLADGRPLFESVVRLRGVAGVPERGAALELAVDPARPGEARLRHDRSRVTPAVARRVAGHLRTLVRALPEDPDRPVAAVPLLTAEELERVVGEWNDTRTDFRLDRCLHDLFAERARERPEAAAILRGDRRMSYAELDARARALAARLRALGVGPEVRVALVCDRSEELVIGILGVLIAGGCYVPVDPGYPADRIAFALGDSRAPIVLTRGDLRDAIPETGAEIVLLDGGAPAGGTAASASTAPGGVAPPPGSARVDPDNLAYVIYTSGSTGVPKGIALRHRGVVSNLLDLNTSFDIGPDDRVLAISSPSFDMCVYEVLGTLAAGAAIVIPDPRSAKDPAHWAELVKRHRVTVWNSAPQLLGMLIEHAAPRPGLHPVSLRVAILGGDWVPVTMPDQLRVIAPDVRVIVLGGATEASIHSIVYPVDRTDPAWDSIPYGRPMANQTAYILDPALQPVPVGVPGELHLGGVGLARGYFERPALTAERFIPHPFGGIPGDRLFKTGDLARYGEDGTIELLGRLDFQVKIRGHRIELGEIEAALRRLPGVGEAVVAAVGKAERRLVAYLVAVADGAGPGDGDAAARHEETLRRWREVYDETYREPAGAADPTRNFAGWISSLTGRPFSTDEMREIVEGTVERIRSLGLGRVLEIGCGTGLILFRLAPGCERYDASDLSPVAVAGLRAQAAAGALDARRVTLAERPAHDFAPVAPRAYDTVVINSVSQHFPDADYLVRVLEGAVSAARDGGAVFLGDVRCLPLLRAFHAAVEAGPAGAGPDAPDLAARVERGVAMEKELWVDPALFPALAARVPRVAGAEIHLRRGRHVNEMSQYHFDVVLRVGSPGPAAAGVARWSWERDGLDLVALSARLDGGPDAVLVTDVPNARVLREVEAARRLQGGGPPDRAARGGVDPEDLWALAASLPYRVDVLWPASGAPDRFDVVFRRASCAVSTAAIVAGAGAPLSPASPRPWSAYGNRSAAAAPSAGLVDRARAALEKAFPETMVPSAFVVLDELPLSPNGKVDRRALPEPPGARPNLAVEFVAPATALEEAIAGAWSEALEIDRVGAHDDFFELGGHSLSATRIVSRLGETFGVPLRLRDLFAHPSPARLAERMEAIGREEGLDVAEVAEVLVEVGGLSEADVERLLAEEEGRTS